MLLTPMLEDNNIRFFKKHRETGGVLITHGVNNHQHGIELYVGPDDWEEAKNLLEFIQHKVKEEQKK